ncbi:MAG: hypothetical protein JOZ77_02060 [Candidatus Eremiobacteraeota bacterium]|nr:hypothetical protein [Candidatus Eremiobacteraeota bacterium]
MPSDFTSHNANIAPASALRALYSFGTGNDGQTPVSGAVAPSRVAPYPRIIGTTEFGGYYNSGTVYGLTKGASGWTEAVLYEFQGRTDGSRPIGIAVPTKLDQGSPVFVTSFSGGANFDGSVAELKPSPSGTWTLVNTYSFKDTPDGSAPQGPVIEDASGNLYGTTSGGGVHGHGAVYRMQPTGSGYTESLLYSFRGKKDGGYPVGGLIIVNDALYGTTELGGAKGSGTVFELVPSGSGYTERIVYSFRSAPDGKQPEAGLCAQPGGALYGTTIEGGYDGGGTVFKLTPSGSKYVESVIWNFGGFYRDGFNPEGPVIGNGHGVIYGTTLNGGKTGSGTLFTLMPKGSTFKEELQSFSGSNGAAPEAGPGADGKGSLYIATSAGGPHFDGVVARAKGNAAPTSCDPGSVTIGG